MEKIHNPWAGLESEGYNCFGCCPGNSVGLKMEFYEDGDDIVSFMHPSDSYQSWQKTLHGGIQATMMDEIAMWVIARKLQTAGMTTRLDVKYRYPVPAGEDANVEVRARLKEVKHSFAIVEARIISGGRICSSAEITYYCFPKDKSASEYYFHGCRLENEGE